MTDIQYGNEYFSDYQLIPCTFSSSSGAETVSAGSEFSTDQIHIVGTDAFVMIHNNYASALTLHFQTYKADNNGTPCPITAEEFSKINRFANRKESQKLKIDKLDYENIYFLGRFNLQAIKINDIVYGVDFTFISDYPYGFMDEISLQFKGKEFMVYNHSDETGDIYPYTIIKCLEAGNLQITNSMDNEIFELRNCTENEVITIDNQNRIITSSNPNHCLYDDFNFNYIKLCNTYTERRNFYTATLNIEMALKYSPIRKVGI